VTMMPIFSILELHRNSATPFFWGKIPLRIRNVVGSGDSGGILLNVYFFSITAGPSSTMLGGCARGTAGEPGSASGTHHLQFNTEFPDLDPIFVSVDLRLSTWFVSA